MAEKQGITLELEKVMQADAAELVAARQKALIIHHTQDIDTAGEEVEQAARTVIGRRLPTDYYVGRGHVVDSSLSTSADFDVVIAGNNQAPVLFTATDGTQYFPYEAIYALGEIKSGYYKSQRYIEKFSDEIE